MIKKINERGLPSLGGLPGDSFGHNTVPRPSLPSTGAQSRSADSQVAMGRINRGYEDDDKYSDRDMFPDNICDDDEDDSDDVSVSFRQYESVHLFR